MSKEKMTDTQPLGTIETFPIEYQFDSRDGEPVVLITAPSESGERLQLALSAMQLTGFALAYINTGKLISEFKKRGYRVQKYRSTYFGGTWDTI